MGDVSPLLLGLLQLLVVLQLLMVLQQLCVQLLLMMLARSRGRIGERRVASMTDCSSQKGT